MRYGEIWCVTDVIVDFYFAQFFSLLPPANSTKNESFKKKKWKKRLQISSFYTSVAKIMTKCYTVLEIWCATDVIVIFHFVLLFALIKISKKKKKNEKNFWRYHDFTNVYLQLWLDDVRFLKYGAQRTNGQMDGSKKWHIEVSVPPKNW